MASSVNVANTDLVNTFDVWRVRTNLAANDVNEICRGNFTKPAGYVKIETGYLQLAAASGQTLRVNADAGISGVLSVKKIEQDGIGSYIVSDTGDVRFNNAAAQIHFAGNTNTVRFSSNLISNLANTYNSDWLVVGGRSSNGAFILNVNTFLTVSGSGLLGNVAISSNLAVSKNASVSGNVSIGTFANVGATLGVSGNTFLFANLAVSRNASVAGNVSIGTFANVATTLNVGSTLEVGGNTSLYANLAVSRNASVSGNVSIGTFANVGTTLGVSGNSFLLANLIVSQNATVAGNVSIGTAANVGTTLGVSGNSFLFANLTVSQNATVSGNVSIGSRANIAATLNVGSTLEVGGNTALYSNLAVTRNATIGGTLNVSQTLGVTGNTTLSNLVVNGTISQQDLKISEISTNADIGLAGTRRIYLFPASLYKSGKLLIKVETIDGANTQLSEAIVTANATTSHITVYGTVSTPPASVSGTSLIGTFSTNVVTNNVEIYMTTSLNNCKTKVFADLIK